MIKEGGTKAGEIGEKTQAGFVVLSMVLKHQASTLQLSVLIRTH